MKNIISLLVLIFIFSCGTGNQNENTIAVDAGAFQKITKYKPGDPFIKTMKESEYFKVSGLADNVIETKSGTIISVPKGAFRNSNGEIVEKEVNIEITDINSFEEQFNANINSPEGQDILLNGGAIFINATADGAQLGINKNSPIYVELLQESDPDLLMFEGIRNEKGDMQWINPVQPKKHLIPVDLSELDFLPEGFSNKVNENIPFGNYKTSSKKLVDSLYYSLTERKSESNNNINGLKPQRNEVKDYMSSPSYNFGGQNRGATAAAHGVAVDAAYRLCNAIKPASIKTIKKQKFSQTFIATKQFEERIKTIHQTRKQEVLDLYINNLDKDLSYCDDLASKLFNNGTPFAIKFSAYAKENWSNVKDLPRSVKKLGKYYSKKLMSTEKEISKSKRKYERALKKKSVEATKLRNEYKKILTKRQNYRLKKHGFKLQKLGWKAPGKKCKPMIINIKVKDGDQYDRVHVYTFDPSINSIFSWRSLNKIDFQYAFPQDVILIFKSKQKAKALVVAYKDEQPYFDIQDFTAVDVVDIDFSLKTTSQIALNKLIDGLDAKSKKFNKIKVDLEYQTKFYKEKKRLDKEIEKRIVMNTLYYFIYRCGGTHG